MKTEIIPSPGGKDVMLKITTVLGGIQKTVMTRAELHQHDWAIRKYLEGQPFRVAKEATGK